MFRRICLPLSLLIACGGLMAFLAVPAARAAPDEGSKPSGKTPKRTEKKSKIDMSEVDPDERAEKKMLREMGEKFKLKRTLHYSVFYDTSEEDVEAFAYAIEKTYRSCNAYTQRLGVDLRKPKKKLLSHFFNEFVDYQSHAAKIGNGGVTPNTLGFYIPANNMSYFYNIRNTPAFKNARINAEQQLKLLGEQMRATTGKAERKSIEAQIKRLRWVVNRTNGFGGDLTEETLQHEAAHQILWNIGFHNPKEFMCNPRWFAEGMAQIFEPLSDGKASNTGLINKSRLDEYLGLEQNNQLFPLKDFISTMGPFLRGDAGGLAYPQAWAICHYLTRTNREGIKKYVELLNARPKDYKSTPKKEIATFEKAFGKPDEKWERKWKAWMKNVH